MTVSDSLIGYDAPDGAVDLADTEGHDGADDVEEPASAPGGQSSKGRRGARRGGPPTRAQVKAVLDARDAVEAADERERRALARVLGASDESVRELTVALATSAGPKNGRAMADLIDVAESRDAPMAALALAVGNGGAARLRRAWRLAVALDTLSGKPDGNAVVAARSLAEAATSLHSLLTVVQQLAGGR